MQIERLADYDRAAALEQLAALLKACVDGGASVNFLRPLDLAEARGFWTAALSDRTAVTLVARAADRIVGTVRLLPAPQPNGPHRADAAKLLVHPDSRGQGIAAALMTQLEQQARALGRTTLVLDTETGSPAERLYLRWGWERVGVIPDFALTADGVLASATVLTKRVAG